MNAKPLALTLLMVAVSARAQSTMPSANTLLESLRSPDWETRQKAEDQLVAVGAEAVPAINAALQADSVDFELRERLQSVLTRIGQTQLVQPTRVTVKQTFDSPFAAFSFLAQQAGVQPAFESDQAAGRARRQEAIGLDLVDVPWLVAVRDVTARTGFAVEISDTRLTLLDKPPQSLRPPTDFTGPTAVIAASARQLEAFQFGDTVRRTQTFLDLVVELEPKARLVEPTAQLFIHTFTDEAGNVICNDQEFGLSRQTDRRFVSTMILELPAKVPASVGLIEGTLRGEFVTQTRTLRVTDPAMLPRSIELPDGDIEISSLQTIDNASQIAVLIPRELDGRPAGLLIDQVGVEGLEVLDQHQKRMRLNQLSKKALDGVTEYRYTLLGDGVESRPTTVNWTVPVSTQEVSIPFKLERLPLPQ